MSDDVEVIQLTDEEVMMDEDRDTLFYEEPEDHMAALIAQDNKDIAMVGNDVEYPLPAPVGGDNADASGASQLDIFEEPGTPENPARKAKDTQAIDAVVDLEDSPAPPGKESKSTSVKKQRFNDETSDRMMALSEKLRVLKEAQRQRPGKGMARHTLSATALILICLAFPHKFFGACRFLAQTGPSCTRGSGRSTRSCKD